MNPNSAVILALLAADCFISIVSAEDTRPNFIIMQPDDLQFYEEWGPPAHFNGEPEHHYPANSDLPWMNYLRDNGLTMMQAYTASPKCGTSRYSTITGRYPARSSYGRNSAINNFDSTGEYIDVSPVTIPSTKLQDVAVDDGDDCSTGNLAALLKGEGYRTGVTGKWHLLNTNRRDDYQGIQQQVRDCGFDFVEALYKDNISSWATEDGFHHNHEYVTAKALQFIVDEAPSDGTRQPFFLYFNPTIPHGPSVFDALENYNCTDTPAGADSIDISEVNNIPKMTAEYGNSCTAYRQGVIARAGGSTENKDLGAIWTDDSIGALISTLDDVGELNNTYLLFQQDHGQEGKSSLFEPGVRIVQHVHFPNGNFYSHQFHGVVSTIDIGPTIADFAGISYNPGLFTHHYEMDGRSWMSAVQQGDSWPDNDNTCIASAMEKDRSVVCGCDKYIRIYNVSSTNAGTVRDGTDANYGIDFAEEMLFDLCAGTGTYQISPAGSPEMDNQFFARQERSQQLSEFMDCHVAATDPNNVPDYTGCSLPTLAPTPEPTSAPSFSTAPSNEPTPSCSDDSGPVIRRRNGASRSCEWAAQNNRCGALFEEYEWGWTCPIACYGKCCSDSEKFNDEFCLSNDDCCSGLCLAAGTCSFCLEVGRNCGSDTDCCSGFCLGGTCEIVS